MAVAEAGSLTLAAERRLHTSQPSLSRRSATSRIRLGSTVESWRAGVELTAAAVPHRPRAVGLTQVDAAVEAARRAAQPAKRKFALGFLTG